MDSLKIDDAAAASVAIAPRVTLDDINNAIASEYCFTAYDAVACIGGMPISADSPLKLLTLCVITLKNGFTVVGTSAPASAENFDAEVGHNFARDHAKRQLWPLMGFALRDRLAKEAREVELVEALKQQQASDFKQAWDAKEQAR